MWLFVSSCIYEITRLLSLLVLAYISSRLLSLLVLAYISSKEERDMLEEQSGFRQNRSCETLLIKVTDYILNNIDHGNLCGMVLVDLRKAFDLVDHKLMLIKLDMYGCQGKELACFKSYLSERFQSVKYDGVLSDPLPVTIGVPQGSILGPLLFIIFMNDSILEISDMRFDMYADDSTLYTAGKT